MNANVMLKFSRATLAVSILFFFVGFMILCDCPGWFASTALLAALAIPLGSPRVRLYAIIFCIAGISMAAVRSIQMKNTKFKVNEIRRRAFERRNENRSTNASPKIKN